MNQATKGIVAGFAISALLTAPVIAKGGEPTPKGYGTEPCTTLSHDLATSRQVYDRWEFESRLNLIGCDGPPNAHRDPDNNRCADYAYQRARMYVRGGLSEHELAQIARDVSARFSNHGTEDHCTVEEDWSWSYA